MNNLSENRPALDPFRTKGLMSLTFAGLSAVILLVLECVLLSAAIHWGRLQDIIMALIFGLLLIVSFFNLVIGVRGWWRRPKGEAALELAVTHMARLLPEAPIVSRSRPRIPPNKVIYAALPLTFGALSVWCFIAGMHGAGLFILFVTSLFVVLTWVVLNSSRDTREMKLTLDSARELATFENFTFVTSFLPQKPRVREEVPFSEIVDCTFIPGAKSGPGLLRVVTTKGPVDYSESMEHFSSIRALLESIVTINLADSATHEANLKKVPHVRVPWYGWVICGLAFVGLGGLIWILCTKL